jgi:hypothetical protein
MYTDPFSEAKWGIPVDVLRADVSTRRLLPILTAVAIAAIDGVRTYLTEIFGFLTGICLGALRFLAQEVQRTDANENDETGGSRCIAAAAGQPSRTHR